MTVIVQSLFAWVVRATWDASLVVALVLLAQQLLRRRASARWRYNLWLLVMARLMLPAVPQSRWSPFNWVSPDHSARISKTSGPGQPSSNEKLTTEDRFIPIRARSASPLPLAPAARPANVIVADARAVGVVDSEAAIGSDEAPPGAGPDDADSASHGAQDSVSPQRLAVADAPSIHSTSRSVGKAPPVTWESNGGGLIAARRPELRGDAMPSANRAPTVPYLVTETPAPAIHVAAQARSAPMHPVMIASAIRRLLSWLRVNWRAVVAMLWLSGAVVVISHALTASVWLALRVRQASELHNPSLHRLLESCRRQAAARRSPRLVSAPRGMGPALLGIVRPVLLLPPDLPRRLTTSELRLVLLHELGHMRRADVALNWLLAVLEAAHWFNPVIWLAFGRLRADREMACDEWVLSRAAPGARDDARRDYGRAILKLIESLPAGSVPAGAVGVLNGGAWLRKAQLRRRITMIALFDRSGRRASALGLAVSLAVGAVALTGAVRADDEAPKPAAEQPARSEAAPDERAPAQQPDESRGKTEAPPAREEGERTGSDSAAPRKEQPPLAGESAPGAPASPDAAPAESRPAGGAPAPTAVSTSDAPRSEPGMATQGRPAQPAALPAGSAPRAPLAGPGTSSALPPAPRSITVAPGAEPMASGALPSGSAPAAPTALSAGSAPIAPGALPSGSAPPPVAGSSALPGRPGAAGTPIPGAPSSTPVLPSPTAALPGYGGVFSATPPVAVTTPSPASPANEPAAAPTFPAAGREPIGATPAPGGAAAGYVAPPARDPNFGSASAGAPGVAAVPMTRDGKFNPFGARTSAAGHRGSEMNGHVEDADAARADEATAEALHKRIRANFQNVSLTDALHLVADSTGVDVFVDRRALDQAPASPDSPLTVDSPVTLELREPRPADMVLPLLLRSAGGDALGYEISDGVVVITTKARLNRTLVTRTYSVQGMEQMADRLPGLISRTVAPNTWAPQGFANVELFGSSLVVTTTEPNQREIAKLLSLLKHDNGQAWRKAGIGR